ncbi:MAG: LysM peptidoglycan-binding domain-containing protein [Jiangellaceae bacterium]
MTTATILRLAEPTARLAPARPRVVRPASGPTRRPPRPRPVSCEQSYAPDLHGSRLTARGRVLVAGGWLLLGAAAAVGIVRPGVDSPALPTETATVVVEPGYTLWQLATAAGDGAAVDPRVTVDAIVDLNGLRSGGDIHPGDVLLVPLYQ